MDADNWVLALDVSGSRTLMRCVAADGALGAGAEVPNAGRPAPAYWADVLHAALDLVGACPTPPAAAGIAFGGPVDRDGQILSIHVGGWSELDPAGELAARLGVPVRLDNDANCGALGEWTFGRHAGAACLIFMTCSTGIGGGIIESGRMLRGARGLAGELGHITVRPGGRPCGCGSAGCLEAHCSGTAIAARYAEAGGRDAGGGAKGVFEAAAAGDRLAQRVLDEVFDDFGRGIAAIWDAFDPSVLLVGGGVSLAGAALCEPVMAAARPHIMAHRREHLRFEPASLGLEAQLLGAAALAFAAAR